jgi:hypothetical protein
MKEEEENKIRWDLKMLGYTEEIIECIVTHSKKYLETAEAEFKTGGVNLSELQSGAVLVAVEDIEKMPQNIFKDSGKKWKLKKK